MSVLKTYEDYRRLAETLASPEIPIVRPAETGLLSFTPYVSNQCSASCRFCSERRTGEGLAAARLTLCADYTQKLTRALLAQRPRPMFLSLSGVEPSESPAQLKAICRAADQAEAQGCVFTERVMYSNLSGFVRRFDALSGLVRSLRLTRIECSRHHQDENVNQRIVRFRPGEEIRSNRVWIDTVRRLQSVVPVTVDCVMQKTGVASAADATAYLEFLRSVGIRRAVLRELSVFSGHTDANAVSAYITEHRVEMMDVLPRLPEEFSLRSVTEGYYYYSFEYAFRGMQVFFEVSDYDQMEKKHFSDETHKLIFFADGLLYKDWNRRGRVEYEK